MISAASVMVPAGDKLDQMVNMMAMVQMLQLMNQPADGEKEDSHE